MLGVSMREDSQTTQFNRILMPTDFSAASRNALPYAAAIAGFNGARLYIVHVISSVGQTMVPGAEVKATVARDLKGLLNNLDDAGESLPVEVALIVRQGDIAAELDELIREERIDLIVVGTHGRSGFSKLTLGSVAENVFRKASCPVLTVGPHSPADWPARALGAEKAILLATDFGNASRAALPYAASIANRSRSKLVVLHVNRPLPESPVTSIFGDEPIAEELRYAAVQQLQALLSRGLGIEPELRVTFGLPVDGILNEASYNSAGVIVLGLHRRSLLVPAGRLPSTAYRVVIQSRCPVLTVRT
jgi:nucleotide-binding universal stress UspA family protein